MIPLWRMYSGRFAGYQAEERMHDIHGNNIGYFDGRILYALNGQCIGEVYRGQWIGKRVNVGYPFGNPREPESPVDCDPLDDRKKPLKIEGWEDSVFFLGERLGLQKRIWDN